MDDKIQTGLLEAFSVAWEPPFSGSIFEWAKKYIELPSNYAIQGKFEVSPHMVQPFHELLDPSTRQLNLIAATQTGKTLISELFLPYLICNDPGPTMKLHQTVDMAQLFAQTRLLPLLDRCKPVKTMLEYQRYSAKKKGVTLPHMSVIIDGAKENVLHGMSIRYLLLDEVHLYDSDVVQKALSRTTAFSHNRKILVTSQPGVEGDQLSRQNTGLDYEWGWTCPYCNNVQPYFWSKEKEDGTWAGFVWQKIYESGSTEILDYEKTGASTRLFCYYCTGSVGDTPSERHMLNISGSYILLKDNGDHAVKTYRWTAFTNEQISFKEKTIQYLLGRSAHKQTGTTDALMLFNQQVLGKEWKRSTVIDPGKVLTAAFNPSDLWKEEIFRCLTVDYQRKHGQKFYCVTAWSRTECRVLDHSFVATWEEIYNIQKKWNIPSPAVFIDYGYNSEEVAKEAVKHIQPIKVGKRIEAYGWICLKGDGQHDMGFPHKDGTRRYFSQEQKVAVNNFQFARLYLWSNLPIKSSLMWIRDNKSDVKLVLPSNDPEFETHLNAENLEDVLDKRTGLMTKRWVQKHDNNHYLDCMAMAVVAANMRGIFLVPIVDVRYDVSTPNKKVEQE